MTGNLEFVLKYASTKKWAEWEGTRRSGREELAPAPVTPRLGGHGPAFLVPRSQCGPRECSAMALAPACRLSGTLHQLKARRPAEVGSQRPAYRSAGAGGLAGFQVPPPGWVEDSRPGSCPSPQRPESEGQEELASEVASHSTLGDSIQPWSPVKGVSQAAGRMSIREPGSGLLTYQMGFPARDPKRKTASRGLGGVPGPGPAGWSHCRG